MVPDDIELDARTCESAARRYIDDAKRCLDAAEMHKRLAESCAEQAARKSGIAAGMLFRAAELRYDARGGMTSALERRRFGLDARWSLDGVVYDAVWSDGHAVRLCPVHGRRGFNEDALGMTRANGWLFLGLSDLGGYR